MRQTLAVLSLALVSMVVGMGSATAGEIVVIGEGTVSKVPDMATIRVGVSHEAATASEAMMQTSVSIAQVIEAVEAAGLAERDMQTGSVSVGPVWKPKPGRDGSEVSGYVAFNELVLRVRDLDQLGGLLDAVLAEGANRLNGLSLGLTNLAEAQAEARAAAVGDAQTRAEQIAEAAGVTLGPLKRIEEQTGGFEQPMGDMRIARMEAAVVPIVAGESDVRVSVRAIYETIE